MIVRGKGDRQRVVPLGDETYKALLDYGLHPNQHLRHWFGTNAYRATRDIRLVGDLMGHADLRTTTGYVKLVPSDAAVQAVRDLSAGRRRVEDGEGKEQPCNDGGPGERWRP